MSEAKTSPARDVATVIQSEPFQLSLKQALPPGLSQDRFTRAVITALQTNGDILQGDRPSLYASVVRAAQDGLQLDGKEAALVIFNTNVAPKGQKEQWVKKVQYMPMVGGLVKKLGEIGFAVDAQVVHKNDTFEVELGDEPRIIHKPAPLGTPRGEMIGAYAIIKNQKGVVYREIMDADQINMVRASSRANNSLMWTKFASEGWRKSVIRRCAKRIPTVVERLEKVLDADNEAFDLTDNPAPAEGETDKTVVSTQPARPKALDKVLKAAAPKAEPPPPPPPPEPEPDPTPEPEPEPQQQDQSDEFVF